MKGFVFVAAATLAITAVPLAAQSGTNNDADRQGVIAAALDYMEGALNADAARMERGVHPGLTKVVVSTNRETGGQSLSYNTATLLVEWVRSAGERMANMDKTVDVEVFEIGHDLAVARAIGQIWYDFLQLAKIDDQWRIVNVLWARNRLAAEDQTGVAATASDSAAINATALNYIEGAFTGDGDRMARAVHPELTKILLAYDRTTGRPFLHKMGASNLVEGTRAGFGLLPEEERDIQVEVFDISHGIAAVKVYSSQYIDHMQMGKVNGEWRIINVLWVPNPEAQNR